jgi:hypothetical protein
MKEFFIFMTFSVTGWMAGVLAAFIAADVIHVVSPDNVLAGAAMGIGGAFTGIICGLLFLGRRKYE